MGCECTLRSMVQQPKARHEHNCAGDRNGQVRLVDVEHQVHNDARKEQRDDRRDPSTDAQNHLHVPGRFFMSSACAQRLTRCGFVDPGASAKCGELCHDGTSWRPPRRRRMISAALPVAAIAHTIMAPRLDSAGPMSLRSNPIPSSMTRYPTQTTNASANPMMMTRAAKSRHRRQYTVDATSTASRNAITHTAPAATLSASNICAAAGATR